MTKLISAFVLSLVLASPALAGKTSRNPANDCGVAKCPLNMIHCGEGQKRVDQRQPGACCPHFVCVPKAGNCGIAKCPLNMIHCPAPKKRIDVRKPGACCPVWKCVDKDGMSEDAMDVEHADEAEEEGE